MEPVRYLGFLGTRGSNRSVSPKQKLLTAKQITITIKFHLTWLNNLKHVDSMK
jgi:hypothetical protein